jgi:hypothetical protein
VNWRVIIRPKAEADVQEARAWYSQHISGSFVMSRPVALEEWNAL